VAVCAGDLAELIEPLRAAPGEAAVLFDLDGTLAPIVEDPAEAIVPAATRAALRDLPARFALVACVSGRRAVEARRLVGVDELTYAGNHGLEVLAPGEQEAALDPSLGDLAEAARVFALGLRAESLSAVGLRLEDKGPIQALHWRGSPDELGAEQRAREIAEQAQRAGLEPRWGRKVLELRPTAHIDKGTAVRRLLDCPGLGLALFAGDDRTDLDAMHAIRSLVEGGRLRGAVCIGIASEEAPAGLAEEADALLASTEDLVAVLRMLVSEGAPDHGAGA
jgi:trehalose 6-phosphate phosphatase